MDTNKDELQIKVVFSILSQGKLKGLRHRDAFLLITFIIIAVVVIAIVFYLILIKRHINDKTN